MNGTPQTDPLQPVSDWLARRNTGKPMIARALRVAHYVLALVRDFMSGEINLRAMGLVYTTLLSLVPLLALSFSVLKAFGVHNQLEPLLLQLLAPLGAQAGTITQQIIGFVDNMKVGVLGIIGVATLLYTSVSMVAKIEESFNWIWLVGTARGFAQRFGQYLAVLIVGPILMFAAVGLTASVRSSALVTRLAAYEPFGTTILVLTELAPYVLLVTAFSFMYVFIPNTRVRALPAFGGGLFAGVAWQAASVAFTKFVAGPTSSYGAIYAGFAIVIVLLIWLYTGWLIVLFGCRLAFYLQNPRYLAGPPRPSPRSSRGDELLALRIMQALTRQSLAGRPPLPLEELRRQLAAPADGSERAIERLAAAGAIVAVEHSTAWVLARDPATMSMAQLWQWSRGEIEATQQADPALGRLLADFETRGAEAGATSLRDWCTQPPSKAPDAG